MKSWEITKKDLRILLRDPRALFVLLVLPLVFITIIGLTMGKLLGWRNSNQILRVGVVDEISYNDIGGPGWDEEPAGEGQTGDANARGDAQAATAGSAGASGPAEPVETMDAEEKLRQKKIARNIVVKVMNSLQERGGFEVKEILTRERAEHDVQNEAVHAALIFGPDFYRRVSRLSARDILDNELKQGLGKLDVSLISREADSSTHSLVEQLAFAETFKTIVPPVLCKYALHRRFMSKTCADFDEEVEQPTVALAPAQPRPVIKDSAVYSSVVPSYTVFFVFFLVSFMARSMLHERELGTLRRLRIAPIKPMSLLAGKTIPFLMISLIQTAILFVCGRLIFDFSWGAHPYWLLPVIFTTSLAATALGLLVATLVRTESQVSAYANILVITMGGISGCFTPRRWLPDAMRELSLTTPHAWSLIAYEELLGKATPDLSRVLESCAMLTAFAIVFFVAGSLRFRTIE
jgi:ABC-2 type transport system permease protein